jgi:tetratricopeptide (TPR) repeat protein
VLGNLLQKQQAFTAAISEYEAVLAAEPSYFPALTRVAYLYYRQGQVGRAIDTWQRALPVCDDEALRRNIELFLDKLQAELGAYTAVPI